MKKITQSLVAVAVCLLALSIAASAQTHRKLAKSKVQRAKVLINEQGYAPGNLKLRKGVRAKITFLRTTERTCGTEIVIPAYGINKPLPLGQPVLVSFTPKKSGEFGFTCGMNMMHGKLVVQ